MYASMLLRCRSQSSTSCCFVCARADAPRVARARTTSRERIGRTVAGESFPCLTAEDAEGRRGKAEMVQTTKQFPPLPQFDAAGRQGSLISASSAVMQFIFHRTGSGTAELAVF